MLERRPFPLGVYVWIVFALSWPVQIVAGLLADKSPAGNLVSSHAFNASTLLMVPLGIPSLFHRQDAVCSLNTLAMLMVALGALLADRLFIRRGYAGVGWRWGRPWHYAAVVGLVLLSWLVPCMAAATRRVSVSSDHTRLSLARLFVLGLAVALSALGAEFGWRGYLLPNLLDRLRPRKAVLLGGIVWWAWYLPSTTGSAIYAGVTAGSQWRMSVWLSVSAAVSVLVIATCIPVVLHAVILAYIRLRSGSLAVAAAYYAVFECVRDSVGSIKALDPLLVGLWANVVICVIGLCLLWKADWFAFANGARQAELELGENAEPGAPPNGGPATPVRNSSITEGPPSVS